MKRHKFHLFGIMELFQSIQNNQEEFMPLFFDINQPFDLSIFMTANVKNA